MNVQHSRRDDTSRVGRRWTCIVLSIIVVISILFVSLVSHNIKTQQRLIATGDCQITFGGIYRGSKYESTAIDASKTSGETIGNKCLVQSQWMRVAQHQVKLMDNRVIDDWLWIDYHDRINVLVQDPNSSKENPSFLILKQTKYALSSEVSLAVVGGIVEPGGEEPPDAAKREVYEELHVTCNSWTPLGRYRTDVNRGMGWIHPFLARDCKYGVFDDGSGEPSKNADVGAHDMEKQNVQSMTLSEVKVSVMKQKFVEVQWSNTVALAMLHLM